MTALPCASVIATPVVLCAVDEEDCAMVVLSCAYTLTLAVDSIVNDVNIAMLFLMIGFKMNAPYFACLVELWQIICRIYGVVV